MRLASEDAAKLRPEALVLLREELSVRGLTEAAQVSIAAQLRVLSEEEIDQYCALIRAVPCPICHSTAQPLNASVTAKVSSFMIVTTTKNELVVACPSCLDKRSESATSHCTYLGWWCIPWGIIRTIQGLAFNRKMAESHHVAYPNASLRSFVVDNIDLIDAAEGNVNRLHAFLIALSLNQ